MSSARADVDRTGVGVGSTQCPSCPGSAHWPGGRHALSQQMPSTQNPELHWSPVEHGKPRGAGVAGGGDGGGSVGGFGGGPVGGLVGVAGGVAGGVNGGGVLGAAL